MAKTKGASLTMLATDQEKAEQGNTALNFLYAKPPGMAEVRNGGRCDAVKEGEMAPW